MAKEKWSQEAVIPNANSSTMICVLNGYGVSPNNNLLSPTSLLSGETAERIAADIALNNAITAETASRIAGDNNLNNAITAETANRIAADNNLNNAITAETANRIAADNNLNNAITAETATRISNDNSLNNAITAETANRISADSGLQSQINNKSDIGHTHYQLYEPNGTTPFVYTDNGRNFHIDGNIIQTGSTYETHAEKIFTTADTITLRDGAISGLGNGTYAGLVAKLYDGANDGELVFDNNGVARVGDVGNTQPIATREETPTNGNFAVWNSANSRFETAGGSLVGKYLPISGGTETGNVSISKSGPTFILSGNTNDIEKIQFIDGSSSDTYIQNNTTDGKFEIHSNNELSFWNNGSEVVNITDYQTYIGNTLNVPGTTHTVYLSDSGYGTGSTGQILTSTSNGIRWDVMPSLTGNYLPLSGGTITGNETVTGTLTPKYIQDISGTTGAPGQVLTTSTNGVRWGDLTPNIGSSYWNGIHSHRTYFSSNPQDKYIPLVHSHSDNIGKHMISFEIYSREFTHNLSYYGKFFLDCRSYQARLVCLEYNSTGNYAGFFNPSKIKASYTPSSGDITDITIYLYAQSGFGNDGVCYIVNVIGEDTTNYSTNTYYTTSAALSNEITLNGVSDPAILSTLTGTTLDCVYNGLGGSVSTTNLIGNLNADLVDGYHIWSGTQSAYDAIGTKSSNTIYLIT